MALNQPAPLVDYNLFTSDSVAVRELTRTQDDNARKLASDCGDAWGRADHLADGDTANRYPPVLNTHDRSGNRIDQIEFHPAWHRVLDATRASGAATLTSHGGSHVLSTTLMYLAGQVESGHCCPISMLEAGLRCLRLTAPDDLRDRFVPRLAADDGWWIGMGMTEIQGGSDVGANTTKAVSHGDGTATLHGAKWFTSCPHSELILFLARPDGAPEGPAGLGLYLHERSNGGMRIVRLKDKLGTRSMPSAEIELDNAPAFEIPGGLRSMLVMVNTTRLHTAAGALACARRAFNEAVWWAHHRTTFGKALIDHPLHTAVLADMALELEAGWLMTIRLAEAIDAGEDALARILTPLVKLHVTKHATRVTAEALECLGGNGYVETFPLARQLRDVPLQAIWEGSTNVIALDVLRAVKRDGAWDALAAATGATGPDLGPPPDDEFSLRLTASRAARAVAGALLAARSNSGWASEAWRATRIDDREPLVGALPATLADGALEYVVSRSTIGTER